MNEIARPPRLLVSVRNIEETRSALAGGADIIDIKEPARGSLGRADVEVIAAIAAIPEVDRSGIPLSVALGEVNDVDPQAIAALPPNVRFAKLGLARLRYDREWITRWVRVRNAYDRAAASPLEWIAVIYADDLNAHAPVPRAIFTAAASTGCAGVLVDTYSKTGRRLLEYAPAGLLRQWSAAARTQRLMFAAAGRLTTADLAQLKSVAADVIAVRSAVCEGLDRQLAICPQRVGAFKRAMDPITVDGPSPAAT